MFKDVVTALKVERKKVGAGGYKNEISESREIFAHMKSSNRTEFYLAQQADLQADKVLKMYSFDYDGERHFLFEGNYYSYFREHVQGDFIEITLRKRIGGLDDITNE